MTGVRQDLAGASVLVDLKRYDEAASLLARIVAAYPGNSRAWCLLAAAHLGTGRYQEAADAASRAISLAPGYDWPYRLASLAQVHLGKITAARTLASEACRLAPGQWQSYVCLAQAQVAGQTDFAAAERAAATALRLAPDEPDVHFIAGKVSFACGKRKAARAHLERALALDPAHAGALNELGRHAADPARAARYFVHAAQSAPGVSGYGQNVDLTVRRLLALTVYVAGVTSLALGFLASYTRLGRGPVLIGYVVIVVLTVGFTTIQMRRMPPEARPLFQTHRIALALATVYGPILVAVIVAAVTPASALTGALLAVTALILVSRLVAYGILRGGRHGTVSQSSLDRLTESRKHDSGPGDAGGGPQMTVGVIGAPGWVAAHPLASESTGGFPLPADVTGAEPSTRRRRIVPLAAAAVSVVAAVAVTAIVLGKTSAHKPAAMQASTPAATRTSAPEGAPAPAAQPMLIGQLRPGDCLQGPPDVNSVRWWPYVVMAVPCTGKHIAKVYFFSADYWPRTMAFPGHATIIHQAKMECRKAFRAYNGAPVSASAYSFRDISPWDRGNWSFGDRLLLCTAYLRATQYPRKAPPKIFNDGAY